MSFSPRYTLPQLAELACTTKEQHIIRMAIQAAYDLGQYETAMKALLRDVKNAKDLEAQT
jgi:hypothetical protein